MHLMSISQSNTVPRRSLSQKLNERLSKYNQRNGDDYATILVAIDSDELDRLDDRAKLSAFYELQLLGMIESDENYSAKAPGPEECSAWSIGYKRREKRTKPISQSDDEYVFKITSQDINKFKSKAGKGLIVTKMGRNYISNTRNDY